MATPDHEAQLAWERRAGRPAAAAAIACAALPLASFIYLTSALAGDGDDKDSERLLRLDENSTELVVGGVIQAAGVALLPFVLLYLYRVVSHRRPELPRAVFPLAIAAPLLSAGILVALQLVQVDLAAVFADSRDHSEKHADDIWPGDTVLTLASVGFGVNLGVGFVYIMLSLHAMRAGLLSRFMGILGIIVGVLVVLPVFGSGGPPVVQVFWLGALAAMFLDRWPGGRGPAWDSGEQEPWPSRYEAAQAAVPEPTLDVEEEPAKPRPASRKRKRKKRR